MPGHATPNQRCPTKRRSCAGTRLQGPAALGSVRDQDRALRPHSGSGSSTSRGEPTSDRGLDQAAQRTKPLTYHPTGTTLGHMHD